MNKTAYLLMSVIMSFALTLGSYSSAGASPTLAVKSASVVINGVSTPCSTLANCSDLLVSGATMYVSGQWSETLTITATGTSAKPINIIGTDAVLVVSTPNGIWVDGDYINVSGFDISGAKSFGIVVSKTHVKIENNVIHHNVTHNGTIGNCGIAGSWGSALKLLVGAEDIILRGNSVYENCGEGIGATRSVNTLIENNNVRDNYAVNIYIDNSPFTVVQNNVSTCTGINLRNGKRPGGIVLGEESYSGWGSQRHDINILNNSVDGCDYGIVTWESNVGGTLRNVIISGNTITNGITRSISILSKNDNVLVENNLIYAELYVSSPTGVTLINNTIIGVTPTTFADVPLGHPQWKYIEALYQGGFTAGCSTNPLKFCPDVILDRAQAAVFMVRGQLGSTYTPPSAPWNTFLSDSWKGFEWAQPWAEGMYQNGLTAGCQVSPLKYCPATKLPRVEASVFGLRMKYGVNYTPPPATGTLLGDVTDPSYWGAGWAEKAYLDGLLPSCGTQNGKPIFCPNQQVTRAWAAYLIVKAKGLPTP